MRTPCFHILSYSTLSFIPCLSLFLFLFLSLPYHPSPFCSIFTIHQFCCSCLYIFSAFRCRLNAIWNTLSQSHLISGDALWFTILPEYDTVDVFSYHWVPSEDTNALFMFCVFFTVLYYFCFISFMCLVNTDGTSLLKKISCFLLWYCLGVMTASTVALSSQHLNWWRRFWWWEVFVSTLYLLQIFPCPLIKTDFTISPLNLCFLITSTVRNASLLILSPHRINKATKTLPVWQVVMECNESQDGRPVPVTLTHTHSGSELLLGQYQPDETWSWLSSPVVMFMGSSHPCGRGLRCLASSVFLLTELIGPRGETPWPCVGHYSPCRKLWVTTERKRTRDVRLDSVWGYQRGQWVVSDIHDSMWDWLKPHLFVSMSPVSMETHVPSSLSLFLFHSLAHYVSLFLSLHPQVHA